MVFNMEITKGFRTSEVAKLTNLTIRQLGHWDKTGLFKPSLASSEGRGSARFYSFLDIVQLRIAKRLLAAGLNVRRLRKCMDYLRNNLKDVDNIATLSLVTDGISVFSLTDNPMMVIDLLQNMQVAWAIKIADIEPQETIKAILSTKARLSTKYKSTSA